MNDAVNEVGHIVARVAERMGLMTETEFMRAFDPKPTDTSSEEPDTGPRDDDASDPEDDATTAPVEPTKEDPE